jgi:hypothetical protein
MVFADAGPANITKHNAPETTAEKSETRGVASGPDIEFVPSR